MSVFELGVIIGLGSAASAPMFYRSVGLLACVLVFAVIVGMYHLLKFPEPKRPPGRLVRGKPVSVIREGEIVLSTIRRETVALPELFIQLRQRNVTHLGQVQQAILEPTGELSLFYFPDDEVRYGLPVLPELYEHKLSQIKTLDHYACTTCGHTMIIEPSDEEKCPVCKHQLWTAAIKGKRIT